MPPVPSRSAAGDGLRSAEAVGRGEEWDFGSQACSSLGFSWVGVAPVPPACRPDFGLWTVLFYFPFVNSAK